MDGAGAFFTVLLVVFVIFALITIARAARIVRQYEKGIVLRFGKFHALADSGLTFIMPFTDSIVRVDMREQVITVPPQKLITKDNVTVEVDAVVYYKVVDPMKSQFEVQDFGYACTTLAQTHLRNLIGDPPLDETLHARRIDVHNNRLAQHTKDSVPSTSRPVNVVGLDSDVQADADAVALKPPAK